MTTKGDELTGEMHAGVLAFFVVDVNGDVLGVSGGPVGEFDAFEVGGEDVVGFSGRNALGEFTVVVGEDLPADFVGLVGGAADFDSHAVDGTIIRPPHGAGNQSIGLFILVLRSGAKNIRAEAE
jgi:hypothetical protein